MNQKELLIINGKEVNKEMALDEKGNLKSVIYRDPEGHTLEKKDYSWLIQDGYERIYHTVFFYSYGKAYTDNWTFDDQERYKPPAFYSSVDIELKKKSHLIEENLIFIVEDENSVEALKDTGFTATTPYKDKDKDYRFSKNDLKLFRDLNVVIIPNIGSNYRNFAKSIGNILQESKVANSVKVMDLKRILRNYNHSKEIKLFDDFSLANYLKRMKHSLEHYNIEMSYQEIIKGFLISQLNKIDEFDIDYFSLISGEDIEVKKVSWLWYPYIARGKATIMVALPGEGKTYVHSKLSAMISSNTPLPNSSINQEINTIGNHKVLVFSQEDDYSDTLLPRFIKNGGNVKNFICVPSDEMPDTFSDKRIAKWINKIKPDLVIFDALSSFIGEKVDFKSAIQIRQALKPLAKAVEGTETAVLIISHDNKMSSETNPLLRISGSGDIGAFVRSGLQIGKDPDDDRSIILAHFKSNVSKIGKSMKFTFSEAKDGEIPRLDYVGLSDYTAVDLLSHSSINAKPTPQLDKGIAILERHLDLNKGYISVEEAKEEAELNEISYSTLQKACRRLDLERKKVQRNNYWFNSSMITGEQLKDRVANRNCVA